MTDTQRIRGDGSDATVRTGSMLNHRYLFIRQKKELTEIIVDWETANRYEILDEREQRIGAVLEKGSGFAAVLRRGFLRSHRGFEVAVTGAFGETLLWLKRGFFFLFSDLRITDIQGRELGQVRRRFGILYKKYDLLDAQGKLFARIKSPLWRLWTFPVISQRSGREAEISKKWGGALREIFTDADIFRVDFGRGEWTFEERAVIFAASISIDFDFFENNQGKQGLFNMADIG